MLRYLREIVSFKARRDGHRILLIDCIMLYRRHRDRGHFTLGIKSVDEPKLIVGYFLFLPLPPPLGYYDF